MLHIDPDQFVVDSFRLGRKVYQSGFRPKHAISIWRGGTPVGLGVDAYFRNRGLSINHTTIATASYTGIQKQGEVIVKNLEHIAQVVCAEDGLLIIDDVYETGNTIRKVVELIRKMARANAPQDIRVATVHYKPSRSGYDELPLITLHELDGDIWISYPHELNDLTDADDPEDQRIRSKSEPVWNALRAGPTEPRKVDLDAKPFYYVSAQQLLLDSISLGVNIAADQWKPDFLLALWPGGVLAGLPIHEVYKYRLKKEGSEQRAPDHISINTSTTRQSYRNLVLGINYLEETVNKTDRVLIIDTTFRAGRLVNDVITRLKETLRRNLDHDNIRVASVYYNPNDDSTWTSRPDIKKPHYYLKEVDREVIYPASIHKLPDPQRDLRELNPDLWKILFAS